MRFKPTIYKESIYDIDYNRLNKKNIKCLLFDLDNTLALIDDKKPSKKLIEFINELKKDFIVEIITNNASKKRVESYTKELGISATMMALKPFTCGLKKARKKYDLKKSEMAIIGDQLVTDIYAGNKYHITTILVDPLAKKDLKATFINRFIEKKILKKYKKNNILERGKYYE